LHSQATAGRSQDDYLEEAVLRHILAWQPTMLRMSDLIREVAKDPDDFGSRDDVSRAVRELTKAGLLHRLGECVLPTPQLVYVEGMELG
jgi:superfamily II helicase